jgi:predicted transposase/invertase (TIGR01784 family)
MKTDVLLYTLFQNFPALFFELRGEDPEWARSYRFASVEVKQTSFRLDGVFIPETAGQPYYFLECQFQKDDAIYFRLVAEIALYFRRNPHDGPWQAVILFARRSLDPGIPRNYAVLQEQGLIQVLYLEEQTGIGSLAFAVMELLRTPKRGFKTRVKTLLTRLGSEALPPDQQRQIMEMLNTMLVAKFPTLTRQELEAMLNVPSLRNTRVFQEGVEEGERRVLIRQLTKRFAPLPEDIVARLEAITDAARLEQLAEAVLTAPDLESFEQLL